MKKLLLAGAALTAMSSASTAADLAYQATATDWSGYFVGLQVGYGWSNVEYDYINFVGGGTDGDFDVDGVVGGLYFGRNWQSGNWVYGLDSSISFADLNDEHILDPADDDDSITTGLEFFSASRVKVGYAFDNTLLFAAGGLTATRLEVEDSDSGNQQDDNFVFGFTVGAGVETKFAENWSARVEYLYLNYGEENFFEGEAYEIEIQDLDAHIVRAGVAYHF